ncbi:MAG: PEP-CTERM sorting domain-containing protein [Fimbriimonadaceae bacterium]|nr:PEP-CTERM sorting domain-containing protein [Fimbriimonadaceae bacterium]QYK55176.1 MAG: PEP-CTERM sorting domain-containing protein [Fimbriimonadaceae bacterium]
MKNLSLVVFAALGAASNAQNLVGTYTWSANGHTYSLYETPGGMSYLDATAFAEAQGGYLATLVTEDENREVVGSFSNFPTTCYLGGFQPEGETDPNANWQWVTGEAWSFSNWNAGEPNDFGGPGQEQYLQVYADGTWNDISNDYPGFNVGFMVETVPEPVTILAAALGGAALLTRKRRG